MGYSANFGGFYWTQNTVSSYQKLVFSTSVAETYNPAKPWRSTVNLSGTRRSPPVRARGAVYITGMLQQLGSTQPTGPLPNVPLQGALIFGEIPRSEASAAEALPEGLIRVESRSDGLPREEPRAEELQHEGPQRGETVRGKNKFYRIIFRNLICRADLSRMSSVKDVLDKFLHTSRADALAYAILAFHTTISVIVAGR